MKEINRLKVVLVERKQTGKWIAEVIGRDEATISWCCTNKTQPSLETIAKVAKVLDADIKYLLQLRYKKHV